jgi:hypothetical protein
VWWDDVEAGVSGQDPSDRLHAKGGVPVAPRWGHGARRWY